MGNRGGDLETRQEQNSRWYEYGAACVTRAALVPFKRRKREKGGRRSQGLQQGKLSKDDKRERIWRFGGVPMKSRVGPTTSYVVKKNLFFFFFA